MLLNRSNIWLLHNQKCGGKDTAFSFTHFFSHLNLFLYCGFMHYVLRWQFPNIYACRSNQTHTLLSEGLCVKPIVLLLAQLAMSLPSTSQTGSCSLTLAQVNTCSHWRQRGPIRDSVAGDLSFLSSHKQQLYRSQVVETAGAERMGAWVKSCNSVGQNRNWNKPLGPKQKLELRVA